MVGDTKSDIVRSVPTGLGDDLLGGDGDQAALRMPGEEAPISYGSLRVLARGLADVLTRRSVGSANRAALFVPVGPEFAVGLLGALSAGAAVLPVDPASKGDSLKELLDTLRPSVVLTTTSLVRRLEAVADPLKVLTLDWTTSRGAVRVGPEARADSIEIEAKARAGGHLPVGKADPGSDALLIATSGTTGSPKLVRLSHFAIRYNMAAHLESLGLLQPYVAVQALGANYSYGLITSFLATLWAGGTVVVPRFLDRRHVLEAVIGGAAKVCLGTPALFRMLLERSSAADLEALARLEIIGIGGDRCPAHLRRAIAQALPRARCFVTYGLTEAGPRVSTLRPEEFLVKDESVGLPLRGVELEVRDSDNRRCPPGEVGNLFVRTPSLMTGYLVAAGSDPPPDPGPGSWYDTGDLAALDAGGYLWLHGRRDRQTKFRGRRFNPAVVERCLESHPAVVSAQVAVDPAADRLVATARVRPGADGALSQDLLAHCRRNLPNALVPAGVECVADDGFYFKRRRVSMGE